MNHPAAAAPALSGSPRLEGATRNQHSALDDQRFTLIIPRIGAPLGGGTFGGVVLKDDGAPDYLLINGPIAPAAMNWNAALKWAASLNHGEEHVWALPNRSDQRVQWCNSARDFSGEWFWSCAPYAGDESYAWCQYFSLGFQLSTLKDLRLRARAVRRLPIQ